MGQLPLYAGARCKLTRTVHFGKGELDYFLDAGSVSQVATAGNQLLAVFSNSPYLKYLTFLWIIG